MRKQKGLNTDSKYNFKFGRPYNESSSDTKASFSYEIVLEYLRNKYVLSGLAILLAIAVLFVGNSVLNNRLIVVYADDVPVGYVTDKQEYDNMLEILKTAGPIASDDMLVNTEESYPKQVSTNPKEDIVTAFDASGIDEQEVDNSTKYAITNEIKLEPVWKCPEGLEELSISSLLESVNIEVEAAVIMINDTDVVALQDENTAQEVLDIMIKGVVAERGGREVLDYKIQEAIDVALKPVVASSVLTKTDALNLLSTGYTQRKVHVVQRGDSLWSIGHNNGMTVAEVKACNPELKSTLLMPGQEIAIEPLVPFIHIESKEKLTTYEYVPYKTEYTKDSSLYTWQSKTIKSGVRGKNEVVYEITSVNGKEQSRVELSTKVISEPVTRVIAQGTKMPEATGTGSFIWPVDGPGRITSYFGWTGRRYHHGIDIGIPSGTNIFAADDGVVVKATYSSSYGYYIIIDHGNSYSTLYAHNSRLIAKVGTKVKKGAVIARSGNTGNSTGPHLHFEIRKNGDHKNPLNYYK